MFKLRTTKPSPRTCSDRLVGWLLVLLTAVPACRDKADPTGRASVDAKKPRTPDGASAGEGVADARFADVAAQVGLDFAHYIGATGEYYFPEIMGAGCAFIDFDNDGDLDVYLLQGRLLNPTASYSDSVFAPHGSVPPKNRLFRNELISETGAGGQLRFTDVTDESGTGDTGYAMGVGTGDYDNDGDVDLFITNFGRDVLFRNNGDGTFDDVTAEAGLGDPRWTTGAVFLDFDRDGFLDLFVAGYCDFTLDTNKKCYTTSGARDYCAPKAFAPIPDRLYRNLGNGRFLDVSNEVGIDLAYGHGLGVAAADLDRDGWMDIYVANDGDANQLWFNDRSGFTDGGLTSGAAYNFAGNTEAGMGVAVADFDDDQDPDVLVTHLTNETNTLYENRRTRFFEDATEAHRLAAASMAFTGFGVGWLDVNHDARLDLFVAGGDVRFIESLAGDAYPYHQSNQVFLNLGNGRFDERSRESGQVMTLSEVSRGCAFGDVDNDGDVDILINNNNGPVRLLRNDLLAKENWLLVRVLDERGNRDAYGATVQLRLENGRTLTRFVGTDGSYCSASDPRVHLAWPRTMRAASLVVSLPTGGRKTIRPVPTGRVMIIRVAGDGRRSDHDERQ